MQYGWHEWRDMRTNDSVSFVLWYAEWGTIMTQYANKRQCVFCVVMQNGWHEWRDTQTNFCVSFVLWYAEWGTLMTRYANKRQCVFCVVMQNGWHEWRDMRTNDGVSFVLWCRMADMNDAICEQTTVSFVLWCRMADINDAICEQTTVCLLCCDAEWLTWMTRYANKRQCLLCCDAEWLTWMTRDANKRRCVFCVVMQNGWHEWRDMRTNDGVSFVLWCRMGNMNDARCEQTMVCLSYCDAEWGTWMTRDANKRRCVFHIVMQNGEHEWRDMQTNDGVSFVLWCSMVNARCK